MISGLDENVARICTAYLEIADRHTPGLIEGLYLQGSIALSDYHAGMSDIDFVAVTSRAPDPRALAVIHAELRDRQRGPCFEGLYVTWNDLRSHPQQIPAGPAVREWRVDPASRFERNLVTWHVLAQGGVALRGPARGGLNIYTDWPNLAKATERNLIEYWTPWLHRQGRGVIGLTSGAVVWGALGVARLRHSLAAGRITSKTDAAAFAIEIYDERWHRIVREALRIRLRGKPLYRNPWRRRADLIGFVTAALRE